MFNIGGGEVLVILLLALIVLGPQRLPEAARQVGKVMGELRRMSSGFQQRGPQGAMDVADGDKPVHPEEAAHPTAPGPDRRTRRPRTPRRDRSSAASAPSRSPPRHRDPTTSTPAISGRPADPTVGRAP